MDTFRKLYEIRQGLKAKTNEEIAVILNRQLQQTFDVTSAEGMYRSCLLQSVIDRLLVTPQVTILQLEQDRDNSVKGDS